MIEYKTSLIDLDVLRLLKKLGDDYPIRSLVLDVENKKIHISKIFYDKKFYGVLVWRIDVNRRGLNELVCLHVIAEENLPESLNSILAESLPTKAKTAGIDIIRIHGDRSGLNRILNRWMGQPVEQIFEMDLRCQQATAIHNQAQHNKQAQAQQTQE